MAGGYDMHHGVTLAFIGLDGQYPACITGVLGLNCINREREIDLVEHDEGRLMRSFKVK